MFLVVTCICQYRAGCERIVDTCTIEADAAGGLLVTRSEVNQVVHGFEACMQFCMTYNSRETPE